MWLDRQTNGTGEKIKVAGMTKAVILFGLICSFGQVCAVQLATDGTGEVLLFPMFLTGDSVQTVVEVRNQSQTTAKAVRVVFKEPVNGRPVQSVNVYLRPRDSWAIAVHDPQNRSLEDAVATIARWNDQSCTVPALASIPDSGLVFFEDLLTEDLSGLTIPNRLNSGFIEVYELGTVDSEFANDCDAITAAWETGGIWDTDALTSIGTPSGDLSGYASVIDVQKGLAYQFEPIMLDDFRDRPLHTHPRDPRSPSLADVRPAESRIIQSLEFGNRTVQVERISNWSQVPVHAVDALLMTASLRGDFSTSRQASAFASGVLFTPTRAYHTDVQDYYQLAASRVAEPFKETLPPADGNLVENQVSVETVNREAQILDLLPPTNSQNCDQINGSLVFLTLTGILGFDFVCEFSEAQFEIKTGFSEGEVAIHFDGRIVSDEGHVFAGWPVYGAMLQILQNTSVPLPNGQTAIGSYSWARPMLSERRVTDGG